jgi:hypothetical protein
MSKKRGSEHQLPILQPHAAGVDIGADEIYVAVPADRDPQPVRRFGTFTPDLHELADWLNQCGIWSVAMESTAVYWIPLHQILEERGFEIYLVNAHYLKNVPGAQERRLRLPVDSVLALGRTVARQLSTTGGHLCRSFVVASP